MQKLSIIIPAYNEQAFIGQLIERVLRVPIETVGFEKEIIVVDDGSKDRTFEIASSFKQVSVLRQSNGGKGSAVQRGISECSGQYVLVQDADLEYDPSDYLPLLRVVAEWPGAVVYGSRVLGQLKKGVHWDLPGKHPQQGLGPWMAGVILSMWTWLLYRIWISDTLTGYKIYPVGVLKSFKVKTHGFETDHEITAKLIKLGVSIQEVPITYHPRTTLEGKKIGPKDGLIALWTLFKFRFTN